MTNKCTYLVGEDVLPKHSLLYSEFALLNELNNVRYEGNPLSTDIKTKLIKEKFQSEGHKRVTVKVIQCFLKCHNHNIDVKRESITGIDVDIKSDLKSYRDMVNIFGEGFDHEMAEKIILWVTLFGDEKKILKTTIEKEYGHEFIETYFDKIKKLKYKDWGRFSETFLRQLKGIVEDNEYTILEALRNTPYNLMQLLSNQFTFISNIEVFKKRLETKVSGTNYDLIEEMAVSPAVKRSVWQALKLVDEITELKGSAPKKIFVEVARTNRAAKVKKSARQERMLELYKAIKNETYEWEKELQKDIKHDWEKEIKDTESGKFKSKKLYLYYQQMGRCMYSGEIIDLNLLFTDTYNIDHIYPRTLVKDDSFDNLALVKKEENAEKADIYPIKVIKQDKMKTFWETLKTKGFISEKKYERLVRKEALSADDLANFISRQLVETNQSVKATTALLKRLYPDTDIVYVKAENISDFRHTHKFIKVRSINNHHHAKDAYLNIVVGNVYHEKFTKNPRNFIKNGYKFDSSEGRYKAPYSLNKMFDNDLTINGKVIWDKVHSIETVKAMMNNNDVRVTVKPIEQKGALYDATVYKKNVAKVDSYVGLKTGDLRLADVTKYGGFSSIKNAYYSIFKCINKKGIEETHIVAVPITIAHHLNTNLDYESFAKSIFDDSYTNIKVIYKKMCINSLIKVNGFYYYIGGKTNKQVYIDSAIQLLVNDYAAKQIKHLEKVRNWIKENPKVAKEIELSQEENLKLFDYLTNKLTAPIYDSFKNNKYNELVNTAKINFEKLDVQTQGSQLLELLNLLTDQNTVFNFRPCGITASRMVLGMNITKCKEFVIINESITGLNRNEVKII